MGGWIPLNFEALNFSTTDASNVRDKFSDVPPWKSNGHGFVKCWGRALSLPLLRSIPFQDFHGPFRRIGVRPQDEVGPGPYKGLGLFFPAGRQSHPAAELSFLDCP